MEPARPRRAGSLTTFIDVETTGLYLDHLTPDDQSQPHIVQIAAKCTNDEGRVAGAFQAIIRPTGWTIEPGAEKVHGISELRAQREGVDLLPVLALLKSFVDNSAMVVAHNYQFDRSVIASETVRLKRNADWILRRPHDRTFCTMESSTDVLKLPGKYGKFKWPSLAEALTLCPDFIHGGEHDAWHDVEACEAIYRRITQ